MINPTTVGIALTGWSLPIVYLALAAFAGTVLVRNWGRFAWSDRLALVALSAGAAVWASLAGVWIATAAYDSVGQLQSLGWAILEVMLAISAMHVIRRAYVDPHIAVCDHGPGAVATTVHTGNWGQPGWGSRRIRGDGASQGGGSGRRLLNAHQK